MKSFLKNGRYKIVVVLIACVLAGALLAGLTGRGETVQSGIVGTVLSPFHYAAQKIANGLDKAFGGLDADAEYEKKIDALEGELSDMRAKLADYEDVKKQNEMYKEFLELKDEHNEYEFEKASVIARDAADVYKSFTISKGAASGIKKGNAVLYSKSLVGIVDKVYPDYSVVKTVLDPSFHVSAYEIVSGEISYVTGNTALAAKGKCKMANLSSSTKVAYGSIICTAGIGEKVPRGLVIGTVDEISDETTDISSYARITPEVNIDRLTDCIVLKKF